MVLAAFSGRKGSSAYSDTPLSKKLKFEDICAMRPRRASGPELKAQLDTNHVRARAVLERPSQILHADLVLLFFVPSPLLFSAGSRYASNFPISGTPPPFLYKYHLSTSLRDSLPPPLQSTRTKTILRHVRCFRSGLEPKRDELMDDDLASRAAGALPKRLPRVGIHVRIACPPLKSDSRGRMEWKDSKKWWMATPKRPRHRSYSSVSASLLCLSRAISSSS
ncbi:hypothetical protein BU26DRAFT_516697 [Trematosphaeria pertusa]|uniref:Uncharacterized protein n=1 Tax=Trematosphaeria pertusa TaxID=390896 RepID=A0A6A6IQW8_9PLEO|nr:uncharacterized protein BU26DRAFT_516697 [Trematosphaeria pertusa]KAF2251980.1 hypothetical protein BU26DRAFT_516697 [Trematosphaeria pertusa]